MPPSVTRRKASETRYYPGMPREAAVVLQCGNQALPVTVSRARGHCDGDPLHSESAKRAIRKQRTPRCSACILKFGQRSGMLWVLSGNGCSGCFQATDPDRLGTHMTIP